MALSMLVVSCTSDREPFGSSQSSSVDGDVVGDSSVGELTMDDDTLTRSDVDCDADALGSDESARFTVANFVVDGQLGAVCFGDADSDDADVVAEAWRQLAVIAPQGQLGDLGVFGGFQGDDSADEVTLAFVNTIDDDGTLFQMSINIAASVDDPDESLLTMAHEFSHVFTGLDTQLDRSDAAFDRCDTYFNGEGCYLADSLMFAWIETFWSGGLIDEIDPDVQASIADGQDRCDREPGFFGAYAASNPEEDFAESFSAYVFRIDPGTFEQQDKLDWIGQQTGLAEFRDRAVAAGLGPAENRFDPCG